MPLGDRPSLAVRPSSTALGLALLVIPALRAANLKYRKLAQKLSLAVQVD
jgi:hypothetical protein